MNDGAAAFLSKMRESLNPRLTFDDFLTRLSVRDRAAAEKRVAAQDLHPRPQIDLRWRRLACTLMQLAGHSAKFAGRESVQFYIADGRYRMQVFALEDLNDGNLTVYCPDVLEQALAAGFLGLSQAAAPFYAAGSGELLRVEPFNGSVANPAPHFKDMVGWNRRAMRVTLPECASTAQLESTEILCAMAASRFAHPAPVRVAQ